MIVNMQPFKGMFESMKIHFKVLSGLVHSSVYRVWYFSFVIESLDHLYSKQPPMSSGSGVKQKEKEVRPT